MIDMLVRLYALPESRSQRQQLEQDGIILRSPRPYERHIVTTWVAEHFSPKWVSECKVAFSQQPVNCFIATKDKQILGFACCDVTARGFVGPMGVAPSAQGKGLGRALLLMALESLQSKGYVYAVIGGVGPQEFYEKTVGATPITDSSPGLYIDILPDS